MAALALVSAFLIGGLLAVHSSANVQLSKAVGTPYGAAALQICLAAVLLAALAAVSGGFRALAELSTVDGWKLLGGIAGPIYITSGILLFSRVGAVTSVALFVTGQVAASVVLDVGGLFGLEQHPLSLGVGLGAAAVVAGIVGVVGSQPRPGYQPGPGVLGWRGTGLPANQAGWVLLGLVAGAVLPVQGAVNAALRTAISDVLAVSVVSFAVASITICLTLLVLVGLRRTPWPQARPLAQMPWWGWLGVLAAAAYVTASFLVIPVIGAAATVALTITGQQLASAAIDHVGMFRMPVRPVSAARLVGLALLVAGSAAVQLS